MGLQTDPMGWAQTMFGECELADKRLTRRLVHTMAQLARQGAQHQPRVRCECGGPSGRVSSAAQLSGEHQRDE